MKFPFFWKPKIDTQSSGFKLPQTQYNCVSLIHLFYVLSVQLKCQVTGDKIPKATHWTLPCSRLKFNLNNTLTHFDSWAIELGEGFERQQGHWHCTLMSSGPWICLQELECSLFNSLFNHVRCVITTVADCMKWICFVVFIFFSYSC